MSAARPAAQRRRHGSRTGGAQSRRRRRSGPVELPLVELEVPGGPGDHWLRDVAARWEVRFRFRVCRPMGSNPARMLQVVELTGAPGDLGAVEEFLRRRPELSDLTVVSLSPSRRFVRTVGPLPEACARVFESGAFCASCKFLPSVGSKSGDRWSLIIPRSPSTIRQVVGPSSKGEGAPSRILRMRRYVPPRTLTPRQAAALETAFRLGFYSFPRRTNLQEIARILNVSRATASEHLRRAEAKMLAPELPAV